MNIDLKNTYFAQDGTYGNHFLVVNTDKWTKADWERIENCTDSERMKRAYAIAKAKQGKITINDSIQIREGK